MGGGCADLYSGEDGYDRREDKLEKKIPASRADPRFRTGTTGIS